MCLGIQQYDNARLKIRTFYLRLSESFTQNNIPDSVTLCYLPRINGSPLEINGSWIRSDTPGFVTLHRVVTGGSSLFGSRERVKLSEGARFEVYVSEDKLVKGIFRKDEEDEWKMDVKCVLERDILVREAEVCVEVDHLDTAIKEKVNVVVVRRKKVNNGNNNNNKNSNTRYCFLEEIPEQREGEGVESDGCCCCCSGCGEEEIGIDGGDEVDVEGMRWAVDVGIWVVCLGVGYLVSKASSRTLRRKIINM